MILRVHEQERMIFKYKWEQMMLHYALFDIFYNLMRNEQEMSETEQEISFLSVNDWYHPLLLATQEWLLNEIFLNIFILLISDNSVLFCPVHFLSNGNLAHACLRIFCKTHKITFFTTFTNIILAGIIYKSNWNAKLEGLHNIRPSKKSFLLKISTAIPKH